MSRILLVEDRPDVQEVLKEMLEEAGYEVLVAENGYRALDVLERETVDLALVDVILPQMDGLELIMRIRKKYPHLKAIAYSGGGRLLDAETATFLASRLGAVRVLKKPFGKEELVQTIEEVLAEEEEGDEA